MLRSLSEKISEMIGAWELTHNMVFCQAWRSDGGVYYVRYRYRDRKGRWERRSVLSDDPVVAPLMKKLLFAAGLCSRELHEVAQADKTGRLLVYTLDTSICPPRIECVALRRDYNVVEDLLCQ